MTTDKPGLGTCPECGERIPDGWLLVQYQKDDGSEDVWAECPGCEEGVAPE
jgi:hypothetical protein